LAAFAIADLADITPAEVANKIVNGKFITTILKTPDYLDINSIKD